MRVKLKVLAGKNAGRDVTISVPEFFIGRGDGCHLRPRSDLISRKHCVIHVDDDGVRVRDLNSRNGTLLNGERIVDEQPLKLGDHLQVGRLEFEVIVDHSLGGAKRTKVRDMKEAVDRATGDESQLHEVDITDWLEEADEIDRTQRLTDPDTRQFKLDETDRVKLDGGDTVQAEQKTEETSEEETAEERVKRIKGQSKGKLPDRSTADSKDTRDAATDVLKQFFNRR